MSPSGLEKLFKLKKNVTEASRCFQNQDSVGVDLCSELYNIFSNENPKTRLAYLHVRGAQKNTEFKTSNSTKSLN